MTLKKNPTANILPICTNHDTFDHSSVAMLATTIKMSNATCDTDKQFMMMECSRHKTSNKKSSILLKLQCLFIAIRSGNEKKENESQRHLKLTFITVSSSTPKVSSNRHFHTSELCGLISTSIWLMALSRAPVLQLSLPSSSPSISVIDCLDSLILAS